MPRVLLRTGNKRWFPAQPFQGNPGSERSALYELVKLHPGITTDDLQARAKVISRVPSRLAELERDGVLRSEFNCDLFS